MANSKTNKLIQQLRRAALLRDGAGMTDGQLLDCFLNQRDDAAFAALVRRHGPMVWGVCRRVLHHHHDAEDAFQATFLVLVRKAASVEPKEMVANWLYGVAYQTALKARSVAVRRKGRERQVVEMYEPAVEEREEWHDLQPLLDQELSRLPDKYRVPVVLCDLEGKTRKEAARQLGWPEGTVAWRLATARKMLASRLTRRGVALSGGMLAAALSQNASAAGAPTSVVSSTIKAAGLLAAEQAAAGLVSVKVAALTEGVIKTMLLNKLKTAVAALVVLALISIGGLHTHPMAEARRSPQTKQPAARVRLDVGKGAWREMLTMKHEHAITAVACSADWSAAGDEGGALFAWDTKTAKNRRLVVKGGLKKIDHLQFTADEKDLYAPDGKGLYVIWGGGQGIMRCYRKDSKIEGGYGFGGGDFDGVAMGYLGVSTDGEIWLEFFREGRAINLRRNAYVFKMGRFEIRPDFDLNHFDTVEYKAKVSHALVSADHRWLAVATKDGTLHIHDRASLEEKHTITAGKKDVVITAVSFSADGQRIAVARDDALAKIYDTEKGEEIATLKGHGGIVFAVAFSPDGKLVVTGGDDNTARLWDAATGKALAKLEGHADSVRCVAFDPSGEILATGSADKTVKLWKEKADPKKPTQAGSDHRSCF